nr:hypothetical protein Itr_chr12CG15350 [Ipomoea trifida]
MVFQVIWPSGFGPKPYPLHFISRLETRPASAAVPRNRAASPGRERENQWTPFAGRPARLRRLSPTRHLQPPLRLRLAVVLTVTSDDRSHSSNLEPTSLGGGEGTGNPASSSPFSSSHRRMDKPLIKIKQSIKNSDSHKSLASSALMVAVPK